MHNIAQIAVLDLHNAQPLTEEAFGQIRQFYRTHYETISYEKRLLITLATLLLRDTVEQRFISSNTALRLLNEVISDDFSLDLWRETKLQLLRNIVRESNLTATMKDDLLNQHPDLTEFFLRRGARGIMNYNRYRRFHENLIIENMPEHLHADMSKTIWFELMNATETQLFVEPHYVTHLQLIRHNGEVIVTKDSFKVSFPVIDLLDIAPNSSTIRAEIGHLIDFALFRNTDTWTSTYYSPFGEFQDRAAMQSLPHQFSDPQEAQPIIDLYKNYDNNLIQLFQLFVQRALEAKQPLTTFLSDLYFPYEPNGLKERFFSRSTHQILHESHDVNSLPPTEQRIIGEFLFYAAKNDPLLTEHIQRIRKIRAEINTLPWKVRSFFEGGTYLTTYGSAYDQILPPLHPLFGVYAHNVLDSLEEHIGGEWLSFYFRTHVRELLRNGQLTGTALPQFYRTAVYYLHTTAYKNGKPNGKIITETIKNLNPSQLFSDIQNRSVKGHIISSGNVSIAKPANIATPEKIVFNAFAQVLNHLFFSGTITFEQLRSTGRYFAKSIYPSYSKQTIDTTIDIPRDKAFLTQCTDIIFEHLDDAFSSYSVLKQQVLSIMDKPFKDVIPNVQTPANADTTDVVIDLLDQAEALNPSIAQFLAETYETTDILRETSHIVIDYDNVFQSDSPLRNKELLMAFRLMIHASFTLENGKQVMRNQAQHMIFVSLSQTQERMAEAFTEAGLDPNRFILIGKDAPGMTELGVQKYLEINNQISAQSTIFIATPTSEGMSKPYAMEQAIIFNMGDTNDFYSFGVNLRVLFDLLRFNTLPNNINLKNINETVIPMTQLLKTSRTTLDFNQLAGMTITLPHPTNQHKSRVSSLPFNQRLMDEAL